MKTKSELFQTEEYWLENFQNELFRKVHEYMNKEGLNQSQLAAKLGYSKGYISQILNGETNFTFKKLIEVCLKIGIAPDLQLKPIDQYINSEEQRTQTFPEVQVAES